MKNGRGITQAKLEKLRAELKEEFGKIANEKMRGLCKGLEDGLQISVQLTLRYEPQLSCIVSIEPCAALESADSFVLPPDRENDWSATTYQLSPEEWEQIAQLADDTDEGKLIRALCEAGNHIITRDVIAAAFGKPFSNHMIAKVRKKLRDAHDRFRLEQLQVGSGLYGIEKYTPKNRLTHKQ